MALRIESTLSSTLLELTKMPVEIEREFEKDLPIILELMALQLEENVVNEVFGKQKSPKGQAWKRISKLTLAVRRGLKQPSKKLGIGPRRKMLRSFEVGGPGNLFKLRKDGFKYGSKLKKNNKFVAGTFQTRFKMPKKKTATAQAAGSRRGSIQAGIQKNAAKRIRRFMVAVAGVPAPGKGRQLNHPNRQILEMTSKWERQLAAILEEGVRISTEKGIENALKTSKRRTSVKDFGVVVGFAGGAQTNRGRFG